MNTLATTKTTPDAPGLADPQELEDFLDSQIETQLIEQDIAGATIAVVKDGELFFANGYGYAEVETQTPVDPSNTVFLVGSATKLLHGQQLCSYSKRDW